MMHPVTTAAPARGSAPTAQTRGATPDPAARRRRSGKAKDAVITVLGSIGIACVLWLVAAWALNLSVIVFVTGSMAPTMPTGAAAVVQQVSAADLAVGDVVTVPKPSGVPVTHRIVEIADVPGSPDERELTLKGDANDIVDPNTYVVSDAQRVLVSAPLIGWVVIWAKAPIAMIAITLAIALTIAWVLWPTRQRTDS